MSANAITGGLNGPVAISRVRMQVADRLTTQLRDLAGKAGWPSSVIAAMSVRGLGDSWEVTVAPRAKEIVSDLEYGTQTSAPNPVLRRFASQMGQIADRAAGAALENLGAEVLR